MESFLETALHLLGGSKVFVSLVFLVLLIWAFILSFPDDRLHVIACDVGQGDAILVQLRATEVLIDGGPSSEALLACLSRHMPFWDRSIEAIFLTHPQDDHFGGLIEVFARYQVGTLVLNGVSNKTASFEAFRKQVGEERATIHLPKRGDTIRFGNLTFDILFPEQRLGNVQVFQTTEDHQLVLGEAYGSSELNETSVVVHLGFENFDVLLTGDMGFETEEELLAHGDLPDVDVLKVAHHGSKYSSSSQFLEKVDPELAVISVGGRNPHGHPTDETLERLQDVGSVIMRTDLVGDVEVVSDGQEYWVAE